MLFTHSFSDVCLCFLLLRLAFKPEELREALLPTLEKLVTQEPESIPFRMPVDPNSLGIPDYFDIVRQPMDLSTIRKKLESGQYQDPREYVDDVWLMFDNAWLYNRKTSRVYRYCTKVSLRGRTRKTTSSYAPALQMHRRFFFLSPSCRRCSRWRSTR